MLLLLLVVLLLLLLLHRVWRVWVAGLLHTRAAAAPLLLASCRRC